MAGIGHDSGRKESGTSWDPGGGCSITSVCWGWRTKSFLETFGLLMALPEGAMVTKSRRSPRPQTGSHSFVEGEISGQVNIFCFLTEISMVFVVFGWTCR